MDYVVSVFILHICSATLSPTPQSPSPNSQRQQDSGFVEQLGDVSSEPLLVGNTQPPVESNKADQSQPVSIFAAFILQICGVYVCMLTTLLLVLNVTLCVLL